MIALGDCPKSRAAGQDFSEWVSHLRGDIFVILQVYADESGTHDPAGIQPNSEVAVVGGYMARLDDWKRFCQDWQRVLDRYEVKGFHTKRFNPKAKPYRSWDENKFESFKYALAEIAGRNIPLSGAYHIKEQHRGRNVKGYAYTSPIRLFFSDLREALKENGLLKEKISPIFDNNTCKQWGAAIYDEIQILKKDGIKIVDHTYGDDELLLPLQAADMISSFSRKRHLEKLENQISAWRQTGIRKNCTLTPTVLEIMLYRNMRPKMGFNPIVNDVLGNEILQLVPKYASVKRSLRELQSSNVKPWINRCK